MSDVKKTGPRPSDKYIPWYIAAFFVVMISVLAPMGYLSVHTLPGVVTENSYEKGLAYNKSIATGAQEQALGWQGTITIDAIGNDLKATYILQDAHSQPINDAIVHLWLVRPTTAGMDYDAALPSQGNGAYAAPVSLAAHGVWDARVSVTRGGQNFQNEKRIVVP